MTAFVTAVAKPMVEYLQTKHKVPNFNPTIRCDFSARRTTSLGGVKYDGTPYVSLALNRRMEEFGKFKEYSHIAKDRQIGSIEGGWHRVVSALLAHELAHALQWSRYNRATLAASAVDGSLWPLQSADIQSHGKVWQSIYRDLRVNFVNDSQFRKITYTVPEPKQAPKPAAAKPRRTIEKPFYTVEKNRNGGRHAYYYLTGTKTLIGQLFKREGCRVQFCAAGDNKYVHTTFKNQTEARKSLIEPLIRIALALNANKAQKDSTQA